MWLHFYCRFLITNQVLQWKVIVYKKIDLNSVQIKQPSFLSNT